MVDRRGNRDIVTSYAGIIPFCPEEYGHMFEKAGRLAGRDDWKITAGGSSDAKILSQSFGIPSVNLSAGYMHEHSDREIVNYVSTYETANLHRKRLSHRLIAIRDRETLHI